MKMLEKLICRFIADVSRIRDKIRTVEKAIRQFNISLNLTNMEVWRKELDNMCFIYVNEIIDIFEKNNIDVYDYDAYMVQSLNDYIAKREIEKNVNTALNMVNLSENAIDVFRK